ncbi:MAG: protein translocase subunit SecDF [Rikenellaceae bacterium]|nr:protein translocase subunit SecDF [Rikenellaceae bacterium]MCL2692687.1 protein translocase subunit SecDF [Rikenellaceae bacterium]
MQNKGILKVLIVALILSAVYALSFTFVSMRVERAADRHAAQFDIDRQEHARQAFLDSMRTQTVFNLGFVSFTYGEVVEKAINLGLDLRGGMNVLLEISPEDIVRALSNHSQDQTFNQALAEARRSVSGNFVENFAQAYEQLSGGGRLIDIFSTPDAISSRALSMSATNAEVVAYLNSQVESAIENSYMVLSRRIDRFGITQPNIQRVRNTGRILVELPGVREPERVRKLLQGTASLEFWMTYDNERVLPVLIEIDNALRLMLAADTPTVADAEVVEVIDGDGVVVEETAETEQSSLLAQIVGEDTEMDQAAMRAEHPLFSRFSPNTDQFGRAIGGTPIVGHAERHNIPAINEFFAKPEIRALIPHDMILLWGVKGIPDENRRESNVFELYAMRDRSGKGLPDLDGSAVTNAYWDYEQHGSRAQVGMSMNREGAAIWERMTRDALDANNLAAGFTRNIAIVLDSLVYSAPSVINVISGGSSQITGNFTVNEATDLANVLRSGKLPAPARIKQEALVGPTLGAETITASMISFFLAFVLVLIYMIVFYNRAGWVATLALLLNVLLLFGILVSFGAVLTLPGIAGIILTIGIAIDANIIIYERIKEELRGGKALGAAVAAGYKNAMSAIIDANITSVIVGIILFWFGTGPVQGFATTFIIGIITSFFTSIFVTRLIFDGRLRKGKNITFSNKFSENFLANTKFDFLRKRKMFYAISLAVAVICVGSMFVNKLNPGVDFTGGRAYTVRFDQPVNVEQVRTALDNTFATLDSDGDASGRGIVVTEYGNNHQVRIVTQYLIGDDSNEAARRVEEVLFRALAPLYAQAITPAEFSATTEGTTVGIIASDTVEASVAREIVFNAFWAVALGLLGIGLYVIMRFRRWQWGAGSVVALAHDAFITIGVFSLFWKIMPFNMEINQAFIAAILTIIGYSINDKVVIFDRIREYQALYPKRSMRENINNAVNSTLSRTINTTISTLAVLLAIFLFGGEVIRGFIFALLFGIAISIYSSIFIATPVAYDLMQRAKRGEKQIK